MKKSALLIVVAMMLVAQVAKSQNLIAVQNGGAPAFYLQVDDAILNSQDDDTIYIPGGTWNLTQPINKRLHIIGVGHHPDSTNATFQTALLGTLILSSGASHGTLTGIYLKNGSLYGTSDITDNYTVTRCNINGGIASGNWSNFTFIENIIEGSVYGNSGSFNNCTFLNNVINSQCSEFINSVFKNNIFLWNSFCNWGNCSNSIYCHYSLIENNIFYGTTNFLGGVTNSVVKNNLFATEGFPFPSGTNVGSNNIMAQDPNSIFVNYTGNSTSDYHLQPTCPGKNSGTDGTDIGIYGGIYPWKEGSIPSNPHFQSVNVAPVADSIGNLNVNIKVAAQDH